MRLKTQFLLEQLELRLPPAVAADLTARPSATIHRLPVGGQAEAKMSAAEFLELKEKVADTIELTRQASSRSVNAERLARVAEAKATHALGRQEIFSDVAHSVSAGRQLQHQAKQQSQQSSQSRAAGHHAVADSRRQVQFADQVGGAFEEAAVRLETVEHENQRLQRQLQQTQQQLQQTRQAVQPTQQQLHDNQRRLNQLEQQLQTQQQQMAEQQRAAEARSQQQAARQQELLAQIQQEQRQARQQQVNCCVIG